MGERDRLTNRQRERSGEKKDRTRKTEPSKEESGGFDRRKALSDVKQLKKGLGIKAVDFVQELDRLDGLLMRMKKKGRGSLRASGRISNCIARSDR